MKHENHMLRFTLFAVVMMVLFALVMIGCPLHAQYSQPLTVNCPRDGNPAYFDHSVGFGANRVCWYSHMAVSQQWGAGMVKHEVYIACPQ